MSLQSRSEAQRLNAQGIRWIVELLPNASGARKKKYSDTSAIYMVHDIVDHVRKTGGGFSVFDLNYMNSKDAYILDDTEKAAGKKV